MKIIITGSQAINKIDLAKLIIEQDDSLNIGETFISNEDYINEKDGDNYLYYLNNENICIGFKNNAFVYLTRTPDNNSKGLTLDNFYNSDIFVMDILDFNNISESTLRKNNDILVIWLDTKFNKDIEILKNDISETRYLLERLDYIDYMYFLDEDFNNIASIIIKYLSSDSETRKQLREENL